MYPQVCSLNFKFKKVKFDQRGYSKDLKKAMHRSVKAGAREFVARAAKIVPVYSGMAHGALSVAGQAVGLHLTIIQARRKRKGKEQGKVKSRVQEGKNLTEAKFVEKGDQYYFYFKSRVGHLNINDQVDPSQWGIHLRSQAPWRFMKIAGDAGREVMIREFQNRKPRMRKHFKISRRFYHAPRYT